VKDYIILNDGDNVAVACKELPAGERLFLQDLVIRESIPKGHKFAITPIAVGENIIKYGYPIGRATAEIAPGQWVHTHNVKTNLEQEETYTYRPAYCGQEALPHDTFMGYRRENGTVGIRNEIWIIPTVGCIGKTAEAIADAFRGTKLQGVDGVYAFTHPYGCSQMGDDHENTRKILAALCCHGNAGGVLLLGLGCENNQLADMLPLIPHDRRCRLRTLICQEVGDEIAEAIALVNQLADICSHDAREPIDASELIVGLKCGGSDAFSGITANPAVGAFSDILTAKGGCTILTEVPEMFGAEIPLLARCENETVFHSAVDMINSFKQYYLHNHQPIYENPSPGNKAGGITTLEEKSLGCTEKAGHSKVRHVLRYGEFAKEKGLQLLTGPGNDLVATTALTASGAHIVLFTTGRGTPFAGAVPTVKISTNSDLYQKKPHWIDFDAGVSLESGSVRRCGEMLYDYVLKLASGEVKTNNEKNGIRDIAIFKTGVTL